MGLKYFWFGFIVALTLVACAGLKPHYYGLSDVQFDHGMLLGPKASDDLPFSKCAPSAQQAQPCVIMFSTEFFALKQDYEDLQQKLIACEKK